MFLLQVSEVPHDTFRHLAWHLVYARRLASDLNKARLTAVFEIHSIRLYQNTVKL